MERHTVHVAALEKTPGGAWKAHRTEVEPHQPNFPGLGVQELLDGTFLAYLRKMLPLEPVDRYGWSVWIDGKEVGRHLPEHVQDAEERWKLKGVDTAGMKVADLLRHALAQQAGLQ